MYQAARLSAAAWTDTSVAADDAARLETTAAHLHGVAIATLMKSRERPPSLSDLSDVAPNLGLQDLRLGPTWARAAGVGACRVQARSRGLCTGVFVASSFGARRLCGAASPLADVRAGPSWAQASGVGACRVQARSVAVIYFAG